jgi:hypothetical protein
MAQQAPIGFGNRLGQVKPPAHLLKFFSITHNCLLLYLINESRRRVKPVNHSTIQRYPQFGIIAEFRRLRINCQLIPELCAQKPSLKFAIKSPQLTEHGPGCLRIQVLVH